MSDVIINIENLKKTYIGPPKVEVLKSLSLQVYKNEILAITGESGSGKTTLLNLIGGIDNITDGIINIAKLSQVPIVPMIWYSPSKWLLEFNTWDKFRFPILGVKTIAVYGEPIYIKSDCTPEEAEEYRLTVENKLKELYQYAQDNFDELIKS